jgi:hypothetical protein
MARGNANQPKYLEKLPVNALKLRNQANLSVIGPLPNLKQGRRPFSQSRDGPDSASASRLIDAMQAFYAAQRGFRSRRGMAEMVNGDITVRDRLECNDAPAEGDSPQRKPESRARGRMCPAMSQQRTDTDNEAAPQKFIRLIGCRDSRRARSTVTGSPALAPGNTLA